MQVTRVIIHESHVWHMYGRHLTALSIKPMTLSMDMSPGSVKLPARMHQWMNLKQTCSCPDYACHNAKCKHVYAVEIYR